jgi:cytochrome b subunit of formate dehydrogenase
MTSPYYQRFSLKQRIEHFLGMSAFILLSLTGFPQKFFDAGWAKAIVGSLGGVGATRMIHRGCGLIFGALFVFHFATNIAMLFDRRRASFALVPTRKDFSDAVATLKYYLGLTEKTPRFDRFDYRQKFEYWGLSAGAVIMLITGLILYLPTLVTRLLPGELIPAAKVAHSSEGLMALLVVVLWHIYNAHLNPDVFPFDTTIFTGKISRERMLHEHPLELERLERTPGGPSKPES